MSRLEELLLPGQSSGTGVTGIAGRPSAPLPSLSFSGQHQAIQQPTALRLSFVSLNLCQISDGQEELLALVPVQTSVPAQHQSTDPAEHHELLKGLNKSCW